MYFRQFTTPIIGEKVGNNFIRYNFEHLQIDREISVILLIGIYIKANQVYKKIAAQI